MLDQGLIHLYIGNGKGKTSACLGLAIRAAGAGLKVLFIQFLKGSYSSELASLQQLGIKVIRTDAVTKFVPFMTDGEREICKKSCVGCFDEAKGAILKGDYDVIVLDEILDAINTGMISESELCEVLTRKAPQVEVVLSGRNPGEAILSLSDYVSKIDAVKHPFDAGISARRGIEY